MVIAVAPRAAAASSQVWRLGVSATCTDGEVCLGFTKLTGSCYFVGGSSGSEAFCASALSSDFGLFAQKIYGTAWSIKHGLLTPSTGVKEFFITDGTVEFGGPVASLFLELGIPQAAGCSVTGQTFTCSIPDAKAAGMYDPDTVNPVILGHYASDVCWTSGVIDAGCSFIQELTLIT